MYPSAVPGGSDAMDGVEALVEADGVEALVEAEHDEPMPEGDGLEPGGEELASGDEARSAVDPD